MLHGRTQAQEHPVIPWQDRSGKFSPFKLLVFLGLLVPGIYVAAALATGTMGAKPIEAALHETGEWTVRFLLITLAVTPLRRLAEWRRVIHVRRMLGVATFCYALIHLGLYVVDQNFVIGKVASEIVIRFYLTIGFVALLGLAALAATSTDSAVRRLGKKWTLLHKAVYAIAVLGLVHQFIQSKIDVTEPAIMTGLYLLLMGYRLAKRYKIALNTWKLGLFAIIASALTAGAEAAWYWASSTSIDPLLVLQANLDFSFSIRPMWWVLGIGLAVAVVYLLRQIDWSKVGPAEAGTASR
jgi:sulfoxide reductase heme-binding subunit YedZ